MMRKFFFPAMLAVACSGIWTDCKKNDSPDNLSGANLGDTVELAFQETATYQPGDFMVTFDSIFNESRCPADVLCVWEGMVTAKLKFTVGQTSATDTLHVFGTGESRPPDSTVVAGYTVKLINVLPYPQNSNPIPQAEYRVKVVVTQ